MKCYICDAQLAQDEIKLHPIMKKWEPCGRCLEAIADSFEPDSEEEIDQQIAAEGYYDDLRVSEPTTEGSTFLKDSP